jgi:ADP-L-glycero-D-manno-heptose 6-epimerase
MILVTGGAGFIGSNLVKQLNIDYPAVPIVVVDDLTDGVKFKNLSDCVVADYLDQHDFLERIKQNKYFPKLKAVFHQGACSTTTEWNGQYMMKNNYEYSKVLLHYCLTWKIPFIYASSASVYGSGSIFREAQQYEKPVNVYAYSKYLFDQYVRNILPIARIPIVGLRYFNVYGPKEDHKGKMASMVFHADRQLRETGIISLFQGSNGYGDGEQQRDFVYVNDAVAINLWFLKSKKSGIYNVGTGRSASFNSLAQAVINFHGSGEIRYVPFPVLLQGHYQSFTQADLSQLRSIGYRAVFRPIAEGVRDYLLVIHNK